MISLRHRILWASLLASATFASSGVFAQPAPQAAPAAPVTGQAQPGIPGQRMAHGDPAQRFARMQAHRAKRLAELKAKLDLSPAQESAWTHFTAATQPPGPPLERPDRAEFAKLTTPQRLDRMQARQAERREMFARRADATRTFYAALNPAQQKTFDTETAHMMGHRPHGRGHDREPHHNE